MRRAHLEKEIPSIAVYIRSELIRMREATIAVTECNSLSFPYVRSLSLSLSFLIYMLKLIAETAHACDR
jgi:hypothetical protein